jgi:hypothetical protein
LHISSREEHPLGHERLRALGELRADVREGEQARVAIAGNFLHQHGGFGQARLHDALGLAFAGEDRPCLLSASARTSVCSA